MSAEDAGRLNVDDIAALRRLVQSEGRDARNIVVWTVPARGAVVIMSIANVML